MTAADARPGTEVISGWGRSTPSAARVCEATGPDDLAIAVSAGHRRGIALRGLGRSYGDAAQNAGGVVAVTAGGGEITSFDSRTGLMTATAGVSLADLIDVAVPNGWFLPVTPGTRWVTVGGAVASDVHGKDHPVAGSWCTHVRNLTLALPDGDVVAVGPTADPELFWATAGGMGLTGAVVNCTFQLQPIGTSRLVVDTRRVPDLDATLALLDGTPDDRPHRVAWLDLAGSHQGRGVVSLARFARPDELSDGGEPLAYQPAMAPTVPEWSPGVMALPGTARMLNEAWFQLSPRRRVDQVQPLLKFFYALDAASEWNRLYGRRGFVQWQAAVPTNATGALEAVVGLLRRERAAPTMAVLKRLGTADPGPLSFPMPGWTLALDFPAGVAGLPRALDLLDDLVAASGGRIYLAKDGRMRPELLATMYPRLDEWRAVRERVDPGHQLQTDLGRRLGLCH